jgi:hypothetical protein
MEIQGKTVLVLGGWGLVGSAICRRLMAEDPKRIVVTSLNAEEAHEAVSLLRKEFPGKGRNFFIPWWGNIFVRHELRNIPRDHILSNSRYRQMFIEDIAEDLHESVLKRSGLYRLIMKYKPEVVIDCVNSATAIAYQDIFQVSSNVLRMVKQVRHKVNKHSVNDLAEATERLLCTLYVPQLIRHVQIIYRSMSEARTRIYVKIGTSGTGGMGLNIPYTHSEERPSRVLLAKSAVAGAHTLMLFLMGRTPDAPITKEIKPTAAIAWKRIAFGDVLKRGKPIELVDCPPEKAVRLESSFELKPIPHLRRTGETLKSVFIDTGENGLFSRGEFEAISTPGQMEFVTPEEIAENAVFEIMAGNTGHDIINALDNATLSPTYRAGFMFNAAVEKMKALEDESGSASVAFEMLGPPRLSKLLFESYLLKCGFSDIRTVARTDAKTLSRRLHEIVTDDRHLRSQIISIGIPILLPDGKSILRGTAVKIPVFRGEARLPVNVKSIDHWAHDGWVDLRVKNMEKWRARMKTLMKMVQEMPPGETSSRTMYNLDYWSNFSDINPGKICGWIFSYEEKGIRMKA